MESQRILVIDDSKEIVRHLTKQVLPTFGFEALSAPNGSAGLRLIKTERPDLVMLDLNLPEMNGLDVLHAMARESITVPVILMTGYGSEKDAIEAFRLGIRDYLVKPFTVDEVVETINKVLDQEKNRYGNSERLAEDVRRLKTDIARVVNESNTLFSIGKAVASLLDVNKVIERVLDASIYLTNGEESTIWIHDRKANKLRAFAKKGHDQKLLPVDLNRRDSLVGEVLREGHPIRKMAFSGGGIKIQTGFLARAVLYVPLSVRGVTIGVLSVSNLRAPRPFTERHESLLSVLADYAAIALENSRAFQATDRALAVGMDELKTLNQITRTVTSHIDLSEVVRLTIKQIHASWKIHASSLWLYNEEKHAISVLANVGTADEEILSQLEVPADKGFVGHVVQSGKSFYTNEVNSHPLHYKTVDKETGFTTRSLLCVPLIFREKVMGALQLVNKLNGPFDERDIERANSIAAAVAIALSNALLFQQAEAHRRQLESALEYNGNPIIIIDRENRLRLMNEQARSLLHVDSSAIGHLASQIIKQPKIVEIIEEESQGETRKTTALNNGNLWNYILAPIDSQGSRIFVLEQKSNAGEINQIVESLRQVDKELSEQKHVSEEQLASLQTLLEAVKPLRNLLSQSAEMESTSPN